MTSSCSLLAYFSLNDVNLLFLFLCFFFVSKSPTPSLSLSSTMPGPSQSNTGPTQPRPTHIPIPQPVFHALSLTPSSSSPDDPFDNFFFDTAPSTPFDELSRISPDTPFGDLQFHTAPTSPSTEDPASIPHQSHPQALFIPPPLASTPPPPSIPTPLNLPTHAHFSISTPPSEPIPNEPPPEDIFPTVSQQPLEITLDDEAFSPLEKIYLFSRSKAIFHRIFIAHTLPHSLDQITPQDAVEYVIPYISGLAIDEGVFLYLHGLHDQLFSTIFVLKTSQSRRRW